MSTRTAFLLPWPIFGLCVVLTALGLILELMNSSASISWQHYLPRCIDNSLAVPARTRTYRLAAARQ